MADPQVEAIERLSSEVADLTAQVTAVSQGMSVVADNLDAIREVLQAAYNNGWG